jgi:hypothetical protein
MGGQMKIITRGQPTKVNRSLCKKSIKWYAEKLIPERKLKNKIIRVQFEKELLKKHGIFGECFDDDQEKHTYDIIMDSALSKTQMLTALAHEVTHIKQFINGELKNMSGPFCKWNGIKVNYEEIEYWDHPWEIDAHGREKGLYYRFLDSLKRKKNDVSVRVLS